MLAFGPAGDVYSWYEAVSAAPYGAKNAETWRRAGSPKLCPARDCDQNVRHYPRRDPDEALIFRAGRVPSDKRASWAPTPAELLALPQKAAALKAELSKRYPAGRVGVALHLPPSGADRIQLVIDRQSGDLLAVQHIAPMPGLPPGVPWQASIIKRAGWSNVRPVPPPGCTDCTGTY